MNESTNPQTLNDNVEQKMSVEKGGDEESTRLASAVEGEALADVKSTVGVPTQAPDTGVKSDPMGGAKAKASVSGQATPAQTIEELDRLEEEYTDQEYESMVKLYEETLSDFVSGEVVTGKVLAVNDKEVSVDIGFKSEGSIPIEEFNDPSDIVIGDNIEVFIDDVEDAEGLLVLSKKKADFMRIWAQINESYEKGVVIQGRCVRRIKGGIVVDLDGVDAFLPGSQIDVRPIRDFDALIGQMMDFKIVKINNLRKNIVVSHRALVEEEMKGQRDKILQDLERGQILEGAVKNITDFGVFIDLGGVDGLLHINDLSWGRVSHPSEVVALDEKIKVVVLDYNDDKDRISLGLKQLQPHPWEDVESKYPVGSTVRGKVVSISDYGAFVELERGVEGLVHISEMSWTQHIKHPSKVLAVGEMIEARVLNILKDERKISLGLKQLEPDPWDTLSERYPIGSNHKGKVRNLTNFGAFVELEEGIDGLIHISDLSWTKKIRHPGEVLKKGDDVDVVVLNVDRDNRRISLGYKQTQDNPWDQFEDKYKPTQKTEGKVVRLIEKGLIAELPDGVDGFVPMSQLAKGGLSKPADGYQIDDMIQLVVIEFNKENKKIVLSEKAAVYANAKEKSALAAAEQQKIAEEAKEFESAEGDVPMQEVLPVVEDAVVEEPPAVEESPTVEEPPKVVEPASDEESPADSSDPIEPAPPEEEMK
jgi:small subunit ribosomal protein S1